jgi:hypothetical protein
VFSIRDAHLVELMRGIRDYPPQELVNRFEQTGDIVYFVKICDKIRATLTLPSIIQSFAIKWTHHSAQHLCTLFGGGSDAHRIPPPGQGQASEDMLLLVALCGPHLGSYVRHFGFCLQQDTLLHSCLPCASSEKSRAVSLWRESRLACIRAEMTARFPLEKTTD